MCQQQNYCGALTLWRWAPVVWISQENYVLLCMKHLNLYFKGYWGPKSWAMSIQHVMTSTNFKLMYTEFHAFNIGDKFSVYINYQMPIKIIKTLNLLPAVLAPRHDLWATEIINDNDYYEYTLCSIESLWVLWLSLNN